MCGAIPPLPRYAFMAWCSVKAQGQLYLYPINIYVSATSKDKEPYVLIPIMNFRN
jgi:hypothetical protein